MGDAAHATSSSQSPGFTWVIENAFVPATLLVNLTDSAHFTVALVASNMISKTRTQRITPSCRGAEELRGVKQEGVEMDMGETTGRLDANMHQTLYRNVVAKSQDGVESVWGSP